MTADEAELRRSRQIDPNFAALERLIEIAKSDTGQSKRVANFLLAWWNAERDGGFDLTDLWAVDTAIADDMMTVIGFIRRRHCYPCQIGYGADFEEIVVGWRGRRKRRARR